MVILRQELVETQKARSVLIKWKLLLVSILGATGLGFAKNNSNVNTEVLLCCIPFVCIYVDSQYLSLHLRITGIATFFREIAPHVGVSRPFTEYEKFMNFARNKILKSYLKLGGYSPQSWNMKASSLLFSGFIALYALGSFISSQHKPDILLTLAMFLTGIGGIVFDLWLFRHNQDRCEIIEDAGKEFAVRIYKANTELTI